MYAIICWIGIAMCDYFVWCGCGLLGLIFLISITTFTLRLLQYPIHVKYVKENSENKQTQTKMIGKSIICTLV